MSSSRRQTTWQARDLAFLLTALLLHAALFLLPLKSWHSAAPATAPRLTVKLQTLPRPTTNDPLQKTAVADSALVSNHEPVTESAAIPEQEPISERGTAHIELEPLPIETDPVLPDSDELPTSEQLREWITQAELEKSATLRAQTLGKAKSYQAPAHWRKNAGAPYLAALDNRFNGMTVPAEVEIADRWQAADGSHNVLVNLPNGQTMCGRAEAYNPMQPLVEPVMMFRLCGGGGKRTFTTPEHYDQSR